MKRPDEIREELFKLSNNTLSGLTDVNRDITSMIAEMIDSLYLFGNGEQYQLEKELRTNIEKVDLWLKIIQVKFDKLKELKRN